MESRFGVFTISLDFELYWGMRDVVSILEYEENLKGTPNAIKGILELFKEYNIHSTWAVVGFLFFENLNTLKKHSPKKRAEYKNIDIDLYRYIEQNPDLEPEYHFGLESIKLISSYPNQEIATHTFSHYYTLEDGANIDSFYDDLKAAKEVAKKYDISIESIVFPRNQYDNSSLETISRVGIKNYRGNEMGWIYSADSEKRKKSLLKRVLRLIDSYINISGYHTYPLKNPSLKSPFNIPSSRFLRPYSKTLSPLDSFKLKRVKDAMKNAAKNGELFHLWWHPHNFGSNTKENLIFLTKILRYYKELESLYGFKSLNMGEVGRVL